MRTINSAELPHDLDKLTMIKNRERTYHQKMGSVLERTLSHCKALIAENQVQADKIRETSKKEGVAVGFQLFFTQLTSMLDEYARQQDERFALYRQALLDGVKASLRDPVVVECIIHHLHEKSGHQKAIKIIIPHGVCLPDDTDKSNFQFTDGNNITLQNEQDFIRFPGDYLCQMWEDKANSELYYMNEKINNLIPATLAKLGEELLELSKKKEEENNNECCK